MAKDADILNRIVAVIIDHIILFLILIVISLPLGLSAAAYSIMPGMANPFIFMSNMAVLAGMIALNFIIWIAYFTYFEGSSGQTPGKRIMGIRVVKASGIIRKGKVTYSDAFIRTILRVIDGIGAYVVGLIVIVVSQKKQRIGDMAAKTIVVKA